MKIIGLGFSNTIVTGTDNYLLLQHRFNAKKYKNYYSTLGGNHNENANNGREEGLRELYEELGKKYNPKLRRNHIMIELTNKKGKVIETNKIFKKNISNHTYNVGVFVLSLDTPKDIEERFPTGTDKLKNKGYTHWINWMLHFEAPFDVQNIKLQEGASYSIKISDWKKSKPSPIMSEYGQIIDKVLEDKEPAIPYATNIETLDLLLKKEKVNVPAILHKYI